jgi:hypothetical protein
VNIKKKAKSQQGKLTKRVKSLSADAAHAIEQGIESTGVDNVLQRALSFVSAGGPLVKGALMKVGRFLRKHPVAAASVGLGAAVAVAGGGLARHYLRS